MRVIKEAFKDEIRLSVFYWNNKYLIKYELGPMEQTFKIPEADVLLESDLDGFFEGEFFETVKGRFKEMGESFRKKLESL